MKNFLSLFLCLTLIISCSETGTESKLGNWSDVDKNSFRSLMETVEELNNLGEDKSAFIECYLNKCESNYSSYYLADADEEGAAKLATECANEILSNSSVLGNWPTEDKDTFMIACKASVAQLSETQKTEYCSCALGLSMLKWENGSEADKALPKMTMKEVQEFVTPCIGLLE